MWNWRWPIWDAYYRRLGEHAIPLYNRLDKLQWSTTGNLLDYQSEKLSRLLVHARTTVPYYREAGAGTAIGSFGVLTKQTLQAEMGKLTSERAPQIRHWENCTSGSTGRPTRVMVDSDAHMWRLATGWRGDCFGGLHPTNREVKLWGPLPEGRSALKARAAEMLFNKYTFSIFRMNHDYVRTMHQRIGELRPTYMTGYVSGLCAFVQFAEELGLEAPPLKKVIPTAECCSPEQLEQIQHYFKCPVMQRYGAWEIGDLAHQCEHGNWHQHCEQVFLEVLAEDGSITNTGRGKVLVTHLNNFTMPLVRYQLGDEVDLSDAHCPCGRGLPTMKSVLGRIAESIYCADGTKISSLAFTYWLRYFLIAQFRIVQEELEEVRVLYIPQPECTEADIERLHTALQGVCGPRIHVRMVKVERIEPLPSGKHVHIITKLGQSHHNEPQVSAP